MVLPKQETAIWFALKAAAEDVITSPVMPVYEPGAAITAEPPYILMSDVRNDKVRWSIAGDSILSGTFMLTVHWPLSRAVTHTQLMELGATIAANFPADKCMQWGGVRIRVWRDSDVLSSYVDGPFRVVPVRIFWTTTL